MIRSILVKIYSLKFLLYLLVQLIPQILMNKLFIIILITIISISNAQSKTSIKVLYKKINDQIITNIDLENEKNI